MDEPTPRQPIASVPTRVPERTPPREVRVAAALLLALGMILSANAVVALVFRADIASSVQEDMLVVIPAGELSTLLTVASIVLLVLGALHVLAGIFVRRGRQWARVTAFVASGVLIVLAAVGALVGAGLLAVALLGAGVGVVSLLMQSAASLWFAPPPPPNAVAVTSAPPAPGPWA